MCGLVGIAGNTLGKPKDMFSELLLIDSLRGMHSTGMALVKRFQPEINVVKKAGPSQLLLVDPDYKKAMTDPAKVIIGHNRYATKGAHTETNAHPFLFDNVVGAHNGTLNHWSIKNLHDNHLFDTDSQAIFAHINKWGIEDALKYMSGAWALTWYDKRDNSLNFLRNKERPLFYTYSKDRDLIMWASEVEMLDFVLDRNNQRYEGQVMHFVEKDTHFKWTVPTEAVGKFSGPQMFEAKSSATWSYKSSKKNSYHTPNHGYAAAYGYGDWDDEDWTQQEDSVVWLPKKDDAKGSEDKKNDVPHFCGASQVEGVGRGGNGVQGSLPWEDTRNKPKVQAHIRVDTSKFRTPYKMGKHKIVPKRDFYKIIANGCTFCGESHVEWGEFIDILPERVDGVNLFVCEECYNNDEVFNLYDYICREDAAA